MNRQSSGLSACELTAAEKVYSVRALPFKAIVLFHCLLQYRPVQLDSKAAGQGHR